MRRAAVLAALAAALGSPAAAPAQGPVDLGEGDRPNVTLDAAGTAHIVFTGAGANSRELTYCRLPRGAANCAQRTTINAPGDSLSLPIAVPNGSTVQVVSYRYGLPGTPFDATHLFTSTDGGASFDGGVQIGRAGPGDIALGPGAGLSITIDTGPCGTCFQRVPLDGSSAGDAVAVLSTTHPYNSTAALLDANTPLVVFTDGSANAQFRRFGGAGDPNDAANWAPPVDIGVVDYPILASGPAGMFLIGNSQLSGSTTQARRFDGSTFGAPVQVSEGVRVRDMVQDPAGRLHAVAPAYHPGPTSSALRYMSSNDGVTWHSQDVAWPAFLDRMRLSIGGDHLGVMVGTMGANRVFAYPIGPTAEQPRLARSVGASVVSGTVLIRLPGSRGFTRLTGSDVIPVGSTIDATRGRVRIVAARRGGGTQTADFFQGAFRLAQAPSGLTTLTLVAAAARSSLGSRAGAAKVKVLRKLWASGRGQFRTKGRYATATLRGTEWLTADRTDGTLVRVKEGRVLVRDLQRRRNILLRAGRSYLARR